jgi:mannan endo-1,4-beta-mannosidase
MNLTKYTFALIYILFLISYSSFSQTPHTTLYVNGRSLYTPCGDQILLRGVNKMIIYTGDLALRKQSFAEIRKTGANCTRIVWLANPTDQVDATPAGLDRNIQDCIDNGMIPMVELHDATGDWSMLQQMADYWVSPEVVSVVKKHEKYMLLNIGNEVGNETVTNEQFKAGYITAVTKIRTAGIHCPIVIDAAEWGKNLDMLIATGKDIIDADPDHNLIFSVHMYWAVSEGADEAFITSKLTAAYDANIPLIVGEFTYKFNMDKVCEYVCNYQTIIKDCQNLGFGWLAWEWGPGNGYFDKSCDIMDMTSDSYYSSLKNGWQSDVAIDNQYSIRNTSITPKYILLKGKCDSVASDVDIQNISDNWEIFPNPASDGVSISLTINKEVKAKIQIFNSLGINLGTIYDGILSTGSNSIPLNGIEGLSNGIYFCRLTANSVNSMKEFVIIR